MLGLSIKMNAIKQILLKEYDYSTNGYYFVTVCTDFKKPYLQNQNFKDVVVTELARLNELEGVKIDFSVVMPNHIHVIIILEDSRYALSTVVKRYKSKTTVYAKRIANQGWQLHKLWQPNYFEHIIRNEKALDKIRKYIQNNPEAEKLDWKELDN